MLLHLPVTSSNSLYLRTLPLNPRFTLPIFGESSSAAFSGARCFLMGLSSSETNELRCSAALLSSEDETDMILWWSWSPACGLTACSSLKHQLHARYVVALGYRLLQYLIRASTEKIKSKTIYDRFTVLIMDANRSSLTPCYVKYRSGSKWSNLGWILLVLRSNKADLALKQLSGQPVIAAHATNRRRRRRWRRLRGCTTTFAHDHT